VPPALRAPARSHETSRPRGANNQG